jgi:hypothetical protein
VHAILDFRELNKQIVGKTYPIPKISTTLQELEGFTYTMAHRQVRPSSRQDVHCHISLGQVLLSEIAYGICRIS